MKIIANPVIANFDVLFFGKKGFASLARATRAKYRPKGQTNSPWVELSFGKIRRKVLKQELLFAALEKARRDLVKANKEKTKKEAKKEAKRIKSLDRSKLVAAKDTIKFKLKKSEDNIVKSKEDKNVQYRTLTYELTKLLPFVKGTGQPNQVQIEQFLLAVGAEFKKVFRVYKKRRYYLRITHRYRALKPITKTINGKKVSLKFDGLSAPRSSVDSISDIDAMIRHLIEIYIPKFEKYLKFATSQTSFDFLGFTLETTLSDL